MRDVGSARYEPALLLPCPTVRVLSYSSYQRSAHSISKWILHRAKSKWNPAVHLASTYLVWQEGTGPVLSYKPSLLPHTGWGDSMLCLHSCAHLCHLVARWRRMSLLNGFVTCCSNTFTKKCQWHWLKLAGVRPLSPKECTPIVIQLCLRSRIGFWEKHYYVTVDIMHYFLPMWGLQTLLFSLRDCLVWRQSTSAKLTICTYSAALEKYCSAAWKSCSFSNACPTLLNSLAFCWFTCNAAWKIVYSDSLKEKTIIRDIFCLIFRYDYLYDRFAHSQSLTFSARYCSLQNTFTMIFGHF